MNWSGSVAVITGASRGIGRAVALAAARKGAKLGLIARSRGDLEKVAAEAGGTCVVATADVCDRSSVEAALTSMANSLGPIDILVNNAGAGAYGPFTSMDTDLFEQMIRVNYYSTVYAMKAVLPSMLSRNRGHIVNVASIAGRLGAPLESAYSGSKFAVVGMSEAVALELASTKVGLSLIDPGPVATSFFEARGAPYIRKTPKPVSPERVAADVIRAVERNKSETYIPRWLGSAVIARFAMPVLYRKGAAKGVGEDMKSS